MQLKNAFRNLLKIRQERALPPAGPKPPVGSNIVLDRMRIRLKYPISDEQWNWLTAHGWRTVDMRSERRRYAVVPDKGVTRLLQAEGLGREVIHSKMIHLFSEEARTQRRAARAAKEAEVPLLRNSGVGA
ncbi:MAG: hypothetical protein JO002_08730 [Burkholderiaceae bacterium]|nr:hypothetical protein [Burkholderiaceae bacterium]